jgi:ABC-type uncharacterized transport system involved in gliding motility auxiliary subunit
MKSKKADLESMVKYLLWIVFFLVVAGGIYALFYFLRGG